MNRDASRNSLKISSFFNFIGELKQFCKNLNFVVISLV